MTDLGTMQMPPRTLMEVFKNLPEGTLAQLIENNIVMSPAPLDRHQSLLLEISSKLFYFVKAKQLGAVRISPYDVYLDKKMLFNLISVLFQKREQIL